MTLLKKLRSIAVLLFVCTFLISTSLTSCNKGAASGEESTEHPAGEEAEAEKAEHPEGEAEHPESDTTKVAE